MVLRLVRRWGSPGVPTLALLCAYVGARMLLSPSEFRSETLRELFSLPLVSATTTGVAMVVAGVGALVYRAAWTAGVLIGVAMIYGGLVMYVALTRHTGSPTAGAPWFAFGVATAFGVRMKGARGSG